MMEIVWLRDHKGHKRGDVETMHRSDFLKLYNEGLATSKIDWDRKYAAAFAREKEAEKAALAKEKAEAESKEEKDDKKEEDKPKPKRGRPKKWARSEKAETREKAIDNND